ncbi:hypothetical protein SAMN05421823_11572 [Catalinimonas alkaloidigena]|uniref:Conjugative transposon TraJ C-terminal domain-containing protein n=1 Tax=Catalinimonas alkaloidigena TaxID=1075417 RepID=A0A1G9U3Z4_9BACT|nr:hypothetical protein [Catalinimonas alkaloidigena]SDM54374.1 hypothetical protein SAMN05421823_11572 [Catalinimonas alkaloidigena]
MRKIIDQHMLDLLQGLYQHLDENLSTFVGDAQAVCAVFMLLYFAIKAYGMMSGDRKLEIMPLLRPFALSLVVIFWSDFITLINVLPGVVTAKSSTLFDQQVALVDAVMVQRYQLLQQVGTELIERSAEIEELQAGKQESETVAVLGIDLSPLMDTMKGYYIIVMSKIKFWAVNLIENLMVALFQAAVYGVFFLQVVFSGILISLGPFAFAFSILPAFQDAYVQWIARYLSVSFYAALAYLVLSLAFIILQYALLQEVDVLTYITEQGNEAAFLAYVTATDTTSYFTVALLMGGLSMLAIPIISTWIITTSGVGSALNVATRTLTGVSVG